MKKFFGIVFWGRFLFLASFVLAIIFGKFVIADAEMKQLQDVFVRNLTCEYSREPLGIDVCNPVLGWQIVSQRQAISQSAYRIIVSDDLEVLKEDKGNIWDSGKVISSQSQLVRYAGRELKTAQFCYWKVQIWDEQGKPSAWSEPARWSMGILSPNEWKGKWISSRFVEVSTKRGFVDSWGKGNYTPQDVEAVYWRRKVEVVRGVKRATVFICGLGYYELYINGGKVSERVLEPAFSDYQRSVYYAAHDVTGLLRSGGNMFGVILGNGFYNQPGVDFVQMERANWKTPPKVLMNLVIEYTDGGREVVATDESWTWSHGEITYNCIRGGETIDHTKNQKNWNLISFDDSKWNQAVIVPAPIGKLKSQFFPAIHVDEEIKPVKITEPKAGIYLADFGENMTGWIRLKVKGTRGQMVECDYNEMLRGDGTLNTSYSHSHTRGRFQLDQFILNGEGEEVFEPRFTYHGFRYVQIRGLKQMPLAEDIVAKSVHNELPVTGKFLSSDAKLNQLYHAVRRTHHNCAHGMIAEEPTREKMGWTLDAGAAAPTYLYYFDATNLVRKNIQDFIDSQESSGHIAAIVPTTGWSFTYPDGKPFAWDDPWWGGSIFLLVENLYAMTGDLNIIANAFDSMRHYTDFVASTAKDDLVYWSLGDWLQARYDLTSVEQTSTAGYYWMNERVAVYARMLGKKDIADKYIVHAERIKNKFNDTFLDKETGWYRNTQPPKTFSSNDWVPANKKKIVKSQTSQALPLFLGIVPEDMKEKVVARLIEAVDIYDGHINTGFIGSNPLLEYLSERGHVDKAFKMVNKREPSGWLYMVKDEKSTMGECLYGKPDSWHHPYGATVGFWLLKYLGGIRPDPAQPGFKSFIISPHVPDELNELYVEIQSIYGKIQASWKRENNKIKLKVTIPCNTTARLILPFSKEEKILASGNYEFEIEKK
ncbi:MAG: glycoside hydrolase family 78 protein [Planctomycetaceae bacterium]|jgi:alpha-L-rhamnosidase|nr:glycoside hydrolase family 78 protein [Planctomycetaceae bacterium]